MKYIICEDFGGHLVAFLFPDRVDHVDMREQLPYAKVKGAGNINFKDGTFHCFGGSKELGTQAKDEDRDTIMSQFTETEKN